ncbi:hypothetical protein LSTR_LSTR010941 [Laodelphax striatellus]|uniref:Hamartin n=1 Tax=Laodelphax striatellus TaxID=195883 RepID=A0A482XZG2_LAOST|nr:hypothetical protein LSTR_LSTR010941 [Laodelphax striatellus]
MDFTADFKALESNLPPKVEEAKTKFHDYLNSAKEAWVMNGLLDYYFSTGSLRVVEILIGIREPHDKFLFDRLSETMRGTCKLQSLTLLGLIARRNPTWLYKISSHSLLKELLRLLKVETDMVLVMSALLLLIILLPMIAGLIGPVLQEIFEIFSRLAAWNTHNPNKMSESYMLHLQVGLYALFHRLYGMFPCNFLAFLRKEYSQRDIQRDTIFRHTIKPLLDSVKMHPSLIISGKDDETTSRWWIEKAPHDIVVECASFAVESSERQKEFIQDQPRMPAAIERPSLSSRSPLESSGVLDGCYTSRGIRGFRSQLQITADRDIWTPQSLCASPHETSAPTSIPLTPISQAYSSGSAVPQPEGTSPPEAAVEATPETTPIKDIRHSGRGPPPIGSTVVRALNTSLAGAGHSSPVSSQPSSPMRKEPLPYRFPTDNVSAFQQPVKSSIDLKKESAFITQKMQKVLMERNQLIESREKGTGAGVSKPVQPSSPLRLINPVTWPSGGGGGTGGGDAQEVDREVESVLLKGGWTTPGGDDDRVNGHATQDDRMRQSRAVQTDSPLPYEHLFMAALPVQECCHKTAQFSPQTAVEASIVAASKLHDAAATNADVERRRWQDHVGLINLQLQFERHRREVHAERNRRLLGKSRVNRSIEEHNSALKDQVALLQHDTDLVAAEMQRYQQESTQHMRTLRQSEAYWRDRAQHVQLTYNQLTAASQQLNQQLKQERDKTASVTKLALSQLTWSRSASSELSAVQRQLVVQGELQLRVRDMLAAVARGSNRSAQLAMLNDTYNQQIKGLSEQLEVRNFANDALAARVLELEGLLVEKDKIIEKQKLYINEANLKHSELYKSLEGRYSELSSEQVRLKEREVDYISQVEELTNQATAALSQQNAASPIVDNAEGMSDKLAAKALSLQLQNESASDKLAAKALSQQHQNEASPNSVVDTAEGMSDKLAAKALSQQLQNESASDKLAAKALSQHQNEASLNSVVDTAESMSDKLAAKALSQQQQKVASPNSVVDCAAAVGVSDKLAAAVGAASGGAHQYSLLTRASSLLDSAAASNTPMRTAQQMTAIDYLSDTTAANTPDSTK